jgi:hypothetical protein
MTQQVDCDRGAIPFDPRCYCDHRRFIETGQSTAAIVVVLS